MTEFLKIVSTTILMYVVHAVADHVYRAHCRKSVFHVAFFGNSRMCVALDEGLKLIEQLVTNIFFHQPEKKMI